MGGDVPHERGTLYTPGGACVIKPCPKVHLSLREILLAINVCDRRRVGWLNGFPFITSSPRGMPHEHKMLKEHLPRVIYHQVY